MNVSLMQIIAALVMVGVATGLFFAYRAYLATNSDRRMRAMLESAGLDPEIAASGEIPTIMQEVQGLLAEAAQQRTEEVPCIGFHCYVRPQGEEKPVTPTAAEDSNGPT